MTVYNLYIFDANGSCVYYREWTRTKHADSLPSDDELKLLRGMLVGLKGFCSKISPLDDEVNRFSYSTNVYKLHYYESPTRVKVVLNTDNGCLPLQEELETIFNIYTKFVSQNPLCVPGEVVSSELFTSKLDGYVQSLQVYKK
ncbi:unnamed protein product [Calicophoron daubneyi]|uniref:Trafficking protein particle complex subunit n=1 Tax=Calicophoron daubneyi TaxID=300641 RepID=A0AAV2TS00_CALDB